MKPLYKCEYCDQTGTAEEIEKHEAECIYNYNLKSCFTCIHYQGIKSWNKLNEMTVNCDLNIDLPVNKYKGNCASYERKIEKESPYSDLLKTMFGGARFGK